MMTDELLPLASSGERLGTLINTLQGPGQTHQNKGLSDFQSQGEKPWISSKSSLLTSLPEKTLSSPVALPVFPVNVTDQSLK